MSVDETGSDAHGNKSEAGGRRITRETGDDTAEELADVDSRGGVRETVVSHKGELLLRRRISGDSSRN